MKGQFSEELEVLPDITSIIQVNIILIQIGLKVSFFFLMELERLFPITWKTILGLMTLL